MPIFTSWEVNWKELSLKRASALKDSSKKSINSDWKIELPGEFQIAGTTVRYVRRGLWEKISAKGPTKIPLHLMVLLFHDQNYGIHYEYTIPVNYSAENRSEPENLQDSLYIWTHSGWEGCSVQCGGGERKTIVSCTRIVNKTMTLVNDSACQRVTRPDPQAARLSPDSALEALDSYVLHFGVTPLLAKLNAFHLFCFVVGNLPPEHEKTPLLEVDESGAPDYPFAHPCQSSRIPGHSFPLLTDQ
uniref:A disintegrin and metalloproteinase with thrombospondin motifs 17 n=1 Tax=Sphaerodactylus townsendi TaxID=933632 RepID=A0ACB8E6H1_9SAUR